MKQVLWICAALATCALAACTFQTNTNKAKRISDSIRLEDSLAAVEYLLELERAAAAETTQP